MTQNTQDQIKEVCDSIKELLLQKNAKYGDSALNPERVFSKADAVEQIKVRIDDKLSRIATTGFSAIDEDTLQDLIGYLVLLKIALGRQEKSNPYAVPYEDVLEDYAACPYDYSHYYGQTVYEKEVWPFEAIEEDWEDFWSGDDTDVLWDPSVGPVELSEKEIVDILAKKALDQFEDAEIVATVEKRGFILGVKKDGSTCELGGNGRCV